MTSSTKQEVHNVLHCCLRRTEPRRQVTCTENFVMFGYMVFGRPFVCYRTIVLYVLSVTLVYCGQTVGWIKMKLGTQVGLGPGHIELDGDQLPLSQRGTAPQFSAHICCGQMAGWIKVPLGRELGLGPSDIVLDGEPASPPPKRGQTPNF